MAHRDYRPYLRSVLETRTSNNPRYSLRAFARDLRISPQMLSFVMNRKKGISLEVAADLAERLGLNPSESSYFVDLVSLAHSRGTQAKNLARYRIEERLSASPQYQSLDMDVFHIISDWYHFAILELTFTSGFKNDPKWISERLGISEIEVSQALERLHKLKLLSFVGPNKAKKTDINISAAYGVPSAALRKLAQQLLKKAIDSLDGQSLEERDITNVTMAIDPRLLPKAKEMISDFRRKLCAFLEQGKRTELYVFAPSLFKLTSNKKERSR